MNIVNKVTFKSLAKNRTRTLVTIIGIILSAAMFTAVTTFITSLQSYMINSTIYADGDWEFRADYVPKSYVEDFKADDRVNSLSINVELGCAKSKAYDENRSAEDERFATNYIFVNGIDDKCTELSRINLLEGRMPENSNEIIISLPWMEVTEQQKYSIGEKLTLEIGDRVFDDEKMARNQWCSEEAFVPNGMREYTVVGIYSAFESSYNAVTIATPEDIANAESYSVLLNAKNHSEIYTVTKDAAANSSSEYHDTLLMFYGVSGYGTFYALLFSFAAILIALIMLGSVSLIYNAFAISVSERTKQFGLLKSIGATNKQVRKSVFYEAFLLSIVGIPLGLAAGVAGIGITLKALGGAFASLTNIVSPYTFDLSVNIWALVIAAGIALITVFISAFIPSARATRINAITAIRQSTDIKTPKKLIKTSRVTAKLFGIEGIIASKHFKRNKKRYRATIISLAMSMILFISAKCFCDYLTSSVTGVYGDINCDVALMDTTSTVVEPSNLELYDEISGLKNVDKSLFVAYRNAITSYSDDILSADFKAYRENTMTEETPDFIDLYVLDDESFREYAKKVGVNAEDYFNAEQLTGILCKHISYIDYGEGKYKNYDAITGEVDELSLNIEANGKDKEPLPDTNVKVGVVTTENFFLKDYYRTDPSIAVPASAFFANRNSSALYVSESRNWMLSTLFLSDDSNALSAELEEYKADFGSTSFVYNISESSRVQNNIIMIVQVFSYGFIILISLISVANVFNTISTGIALRRREFAMLRSVGMTKRGMNKMMNFECLLYGFKAILIGLPISIVFAYLIYSSTNIGWQTGFALPWAAMGIALLSVFLVVFITILYSMNKIKKESPIDALKNENI